MRGLCSLALGRTAVCVRESVCVVERESQTERDRERETERARQRECVCVSAKRQNGCVSVSECARHRGGRNYGVSRSMRGLCSLALGRTAVCV